MPATTTLLFMARPPQPVRAALLARLQQHGLSARLGPELFAPAHWHQSLSNLFEATADHRSRLLRIGEELVADTFAMYFNRVAGNTAQAGRIHWSVLARGTPTGFSALLAALGQGLEAAGMTVGNRHTPHLTISYRAPEPLRSQPIEPVEWRVDELQLVERSTRPFGYQMVARWPLRAASSQVGFQLALW